MIRFQQKPNPIISGSIALSMAMVLVADFYTPLGITVWVLYLVPLVLSYLTWSPMVPVGVGATVSLFTLVGLVISSFGIDPSLSLINRAMGIVTAGALATFGYQFITSKLALRKEEWIRVGQTRLSERMLGEQSLITLGQNVLHELAEYMDAQGGAIFVADGSRFHRVATHGVPEGTSLPDTFQAGDGLLGQALHAKRPLVVQDLPEGYFTVGSALGRSAPRHLLIAPFGVDGLTNTVVELAFFHPVHQSDRELIDRVAESIAVCIRI